MKSPRLRRTVAWLTNVALIVTQTLQAADAATTLATKPLAHSTANPVRPNLMYVLDNSGSMNWDFTPDYVNDTTSGADRTTPTWGMCWGVSGARNSGGLPLDTDKAVQCSQATQVPYSTAAVNYQFYDPAIRYRPPVRADGTAYPNSTPTAALSDGFDTGSPSRNLTTGWTHQVWCNSATATPTAADPTAGGKCVENSDTSANNLYPNATYVYLKNYNAAAYYFTMAPSEYCTDSTLTNCVRATTSTTIGDVTFNTPAPYRWCANYSTVTHTFSDCQGRRDLTHIIPNYLGGWTAAATDGAFPTADLVIKSFVNGQTITDLSILGPTVVKLAGPISPPDGSTPTDVAKLLCNAVQDSAPTTGYSCATAPTSNELSLRYAVAGETANGFEVLVSGPPAADAIYSAGKIIVLNPTTAGNKITGITINGNSLLATEVISDGNTDNTAKMLCDAINSGPKNGIYAARMPSTAPAGTCTAGSGVELGEVFITRKIADTTDNGAAIVVSGPPPTTITTATITINAPSGATRIDDIQVGGTSILGTKPLLFAGATAEQIAATVQSNITGAGCASTAVGNVITVIGNDGSCSGAVSVLANSTAATATFRVASTGSTNAADLGNIQVTTNQSPAVVKQIVPHLGPTQLTNGTAVSSNASLIQTQINALTATSGFSAAAPVASASIPGTYEITVSAPAGNLYNQQSLTFSNGSSSAGGATGTSPQWKFAITGATSDDRVIDYLRCNRSSGGVLYAMDNDASTGSSANPTDAYTANLAAGLNSNGINGFSYICLHEGNTFNNEICSVTAPSGTCTSNLVITKDDSITIDNYSKLTDGCPASLPPKYQFSIGIVRDSSSDTTDRFVNSITCDGVDTINVNSASTGTGTSNSSRRNTLSTELNDNDKPGWTYNCANTGTSIKCDVTGPNTATCGTLNISSDPWVQVISGSSIKTQGCSPAQPASWTFRIENATSSNKLINSITCGGTNTINTATVSTGTSSGELTRLKNLIGDMQSNDTNGFTIDCSTPTSTTPLSNCTVVGPVGPSACNTADFDCPAGSLRVAHASSITLAGGTAAADVGATPPKRYCVPMTSNGTAAGAAYDDFSVALSNDGPFSGGYQGQGTTTTPFVTKTFGTLATQTEAMTNGSPLSEKTVRTNATGSAPDILVMSGGSAPANANSWVNVGIFKRTDVVPAVTSYPRAPGRTDCAAATCNYAEELQNFANWYSYYRTRMMMMKTTSTLAFSVLDGKYRVGFDDICNCSSGSCATTVKKPLGQFTSTQRSEWWDQLTGSTPSCATPLRAATAKMGRYYAGRLSGADPIQYSCQQNFMLLVTDGYWNESESGAIVDAQSPAKDIGNRDNDAASTPRPFYDGEQASTTCPGIGTNRGNNASSCRTLADITSYYYNTDLRSPALSNGFNRETDEPVAENNVPFTADSPNRAQHMAFFALGLGIDGTLVYRPDYLTSTVGDYAEIKAGTRNWPAVKNLDPTAVDDLWHAAVNGRGKYFSARNPTSVVAGLTEALNLIGQQVGAASAAATSNLEPVAGDNFVYVANYMTGQWTGDLQARTIAVTGEEAGNVSADSVWSAAEQLAEIPFATRRIFVAPVSGVSGDPLRPFTFDNLTAAERANLHPGGNPIDSADKLSQWDDLKVTSAGQITTLNLVNFLRGDRSLEADGVSAHPQIWRKRFGVLGDIVDTQPVFVRKPSFTYVDPGYSTFATTGVAANRKPVVFVSAQDGMLHAFNAHSANIDVGGVPVKPGGEMWSFIPRETLASIKQLADQRYDHRYFIDGPITVGDVNFGDGTTDWHTILVAGLGPGGKSYFALDITDPTEPKFLWEFSAPNLGYTLGNASINKLPSGQWTVFFTSGYNNADGKGYLYGLDVKTGELRTGFPLATDSGAVGSESNLGKIAAWVNEPTRNNTAEFIYSGDLNGDLWRFDLAPGTAGHTSTAVFKLAHLTDEAGKGQPITTRPELTRLENGLHLVFVGTGQYLGIPDLTNTDPQSFYALKDTLGADNLGSGAQETWNPRTDTTTLDTLTINAFARRVLHTHADDGSLLVDAFGLPTRQTCSGANSKVSAATGKCIDDVAPRRMNNDEWNIYGGWFVDFPEPGERMNIDFNLTLGTLTIGTNVPSSSSCTTGGFSEFTSLDFRSGLEVPGTSRAVSRKIATSLIVGINVIKLPGRLSAIVTTAENQQLNLPPSFTPGKFEGRRNLWREIEAYR